METFPYKLKLARKAAGLTQGQLADRLGITKQAVSYYERGNTKPDSQRLLAFAAALKQNTNFFFSRPRLDLEKLNFRKRSKLTGIRLNKLKADVSTHVENLLAVEEALGLNAAFERPAWRGLHLADSSRSVDEAASILRSFWGLALAPIADVTALLLSHGVRVLEVELDEDFDGMSTWVDDRIPLIVINVAALTSTGKPDLVRRRITLVHELAHLILPLVPDISHKDEEKICTRFGASFLLPPLELIRLLGTKRHRVALAELKSLRRTYGLSVAAIVYQSGTYGIIQDYLVQRFWRKRRQEPGLLNERDFGGGELEATGGNYLERLVARGLIEEVLSENKASAILNQPLTYVRELGAGIPGFGDSANG